MNAAPQYHELSPWARLAMFLEALPDPEPLEISQPASLPPAPQSPANKPPLTNRPRRNRTIGAPVGRPGLA